MTKTNTATANGRAVVMVMHVRAGLVTFADGFRIQFLAAVPGWIANRQAHEIREALESGTLFAANFDAFRIPAAVQSFE